VQIVEPSYRILSPIHSPIRDDGPAIERFDPSGILQLIELAGRTCYKSENRITGDSASKFVRMIRDRGHESVLEHSSLTVKFIVDRGVSHELVRHRIAAYSQESTRYCNYGKAGEVMFVKPPFWQDDVHKRDMWVNCMYHACCPTRSRPRS
jgi:thymidylate synthase (FAD)